MGDKHSIELSDLTGKINLLEIRCSRCDRAGKANLFALIEEHGKLMTLPTLRHMLANDCPKLAPRTPYDRCDVFFPQLIAQFPLADGDA